MEGLIPFIYKAIKERRTRSYSRCSSTGSAHGRFGGRVDDGVWGQKQWVAPVREDLADGKFPAEREMTHRRHRSLEELAGEVGASPQWRPGALPRGRSLRIFSCIGGM
ncbi:uncharacterized protein LOC133909348 [Phragmites australis]|uniref:uncharacterized protein LOC133909348 n=1 Tax=Phragmites australis TaxID=29695 RepID=UPI002D78D9AF|nr:uncharacterized protein LOC133909348 [Phragmites australis]